MTDAGHSEGAQIVRSLPLSAYLALRKHARQARGDTVSVARSASQARPVIWIRCDRTDQLLPARTIADRFGDEGEIADFVVTIPALAQDCADDRVIALNDADSTDLAQFFDLWAPDVLVWMGSRVDPAVLAATDGIVPARILVDVGREGLQVRGRWLPGMTGQILRRFDKIVTVDELATEKLVRRYPQARSKTEALGGLRDGAVVLPASEPARASLAKALDNRPVWCAAGVTTGEARLVWQAHRQAMRKSHRLLLVIVPKQPAEGATIAERMRELGMRTQLRTDCPEPSADTQVFVADVPGEKGLWYRLAPVCYMAGSLTAGNCDDPFEPAALGSATVHGPMTAPHEAHFAQLGAAGGSVVVRAADDLGLVISRLLAPDQAAAVANGAWEVTSRDAMATNQLVDWLHAKLETAGY